MVAKLNCDGMLILWGFELFLENRQKVKISGL